MGNDEHKYPSNSYGRPSSTTRKRVERDVQRVTKAQPKIRPKTMGQRFRETFLAMTFGEAVKRVLLEVLIPDTQGTVSDMLKSTIDMMIFGDRKGGRSRGGKAPSFYGSASYQQYYDSQGSPRNDPRQAVSKPYSRPIVEDLVFDTREDAEEVRDSLLGALSEYGAVSVRDLYQFAGMTADYTKDRYGWFSLDGMVVMRVREGWLLDLPRPIVID